MPSNYNDMRSNYPVGNCDQADLNRNVFSAQQRFQRLPANSNGAAFVTSNIPPIQAPDQHTLVVHNNNYGNSQHYINDDTVGHPASTLHPNLENSSSTRPPNNGIMTNANIPKNKNTMSSNQNSNNALNFMNFAFVDENSSQGNLYSDGINVSSQVNGINFNTSSGNSGHTLQNEDTAFENFGRSNGGSASFSNQDNLNGGHGALVKVESNSIPLAAVPPNNNYTQRLMEQPRKQQTFYPHSRLPNEDTTINTSENTSNDVSNFSYSNVHNSANTTAVSSNANSPLVLRSTPSTANNSMIAPPDFLYGDNSMSENYHLLNGKGKHVTFNNYSSLAADTNQTLQNEQQETFQGQENLRHPLQQHQHIMNRIHVPVPITPIKRTYSARIPSNNSSEESTSDKAMRFDLNSVAKTSTPLSLSRDSTPLSDVFVTPTQGIRNISLLSFENMMLHAQSQNNILSRSHKLSSLATSLTKTDTISVSHSTKLNDERLLVQAKRSIDENLTLVQLAKNLGIVKEKKQTAFTDSVIISQKELSLKERSKTVFALRCLLEIAYRVEVNPAFCNESAAPRAAVYSAYLQFCHAISVTPLGHSAVGKLVRVCWSKINTKRLGTRGNSKYHYIGIKLKSAVQLLLKNTTNIQLAATEEYLTSPSSIAGFAKLANIAPNEVSKDGVSPKILRKLVSDPKGEIIKANGTVEDSKNDVLKKPHNTHCDSRVIKEGDAMLNKSAGVAPSNSQNGVSSFTRLPSLVVSKMLPDVDNTPYLSTLNLRLRFPVGFVPFETYSGQPQFFSVLKSQKYKALFQNNILLNLFRQFVLKGDHKNFIKLLVEKNNAGSIVFDLLVYFHILTNLSVLCITGTDKSIIIVKSFASKYRADFEGLLIMTSEASQLSSKNFDKNSNHGIDADQYNIEFNKQRIRYARIFVLILNHLINCSQLAPKLSKILSDQFNLKALQQEWQVLLGKPLLKPSSSRHFDVIGSVDSIITMLDSEVESNGDKEKWSSLFSKSLPRFLRELRLDTANLKSKINRSEAQSHNVADDNEFGSGETNSSSDKENDNSGSFTNALSNFADSNSANEKKNISENPRCSNFGAKGEIRQIGQGANYSRLSALSTYYEHILNNLSVTDLASRKLNSLNRYALHKFVKFIIQEILLLFAEKPIKSNLSLINSIFDKVLSQFSLRQLSKNSGSPLTLSKKKSSKVLVTQQNVDATRRIPEACFSQSSNAARPLNPIANINSTAQNQLRLSSRLSQIGTVEEGDFMNWWGIKCFMDEFLKFYCELYGLEAQIMDFKSSLERGQDFITLQKLEVFNI